MIPADGEGRRLSRCSGPIVAEKVIVAVRAEKVVPKTALAWALTHVVQPGAGITLLAVFSSKRSGRKLWKFPKFTADSGDGAERQDLLDGISRISESCTHMVLQFHDQIQVRVRIKVVSDKPGGAVVAEASNLGANWVVLDKYLKQEVRHCMEELRCNIVMMKGSQAKVVRLNLACSTEIQTPFYSAASSPVRDNDDLLEGYRIKHCCTPVSSPEAALSPSCTRTTEKCSSSSFDTATSIFVVYERNPLFEGGRNKGDLVPVYKQNELDLDYPASSPHTNNNREKVMMSLSKPLRSPPLVENHRNVFWIPQKDEIPTFIRTNQKTHHHQYNNTPISSSTLLDKFIQYDQDMQAGSGRIVSDGHQPSQRQQIINPAIRDVVSLGRTSSLPPPLCSLCRHKAPTFGKPPRRFSCKELKEATNGFSDINFLAQGNIGPVHRGVLRDGQAVAVKQLNYSGSEGDADFSREVCLLSCAHHRNVVLLIGFCVEESKRILVYEYVCNSSLDVHLHENKSSPLDWEARVKIAIGTARGLRYLHEDCRVGCIVQRDLRPHNILLTHDFEPQVSDFGLARWYSESGNSPEEQVIGMSRYRAPEYSDGGKISHRVDVYAFGLLLFELMTGRRSAEMHIHNQQSFSVELFNCITTACEPKEIKCNNFTLLDPCLVTNKAPELLCHQVEAMSHAASICLRRDPELRPSISKVLSILEGGDQSTDPLALDLNTVGNRSGHLNGLIRTQESKWSHSRKLSH